MRDLRDASRLIGQCPDLGDEVRPWRAHLLQGLSGLVDAQVAVGAELRGGQPRWQAILHEPVDVGWPSAAARSCLIRCGEDVDPMQDVTFRPVLHLARPLMTRAREQVIADREWYASVNFNQ